MGIAAKKGEEDMTGTDNYGNQFDCRVCLGVDDYGDICLRCRYTNVVAPLSMMRNMGAHVPGVRQECWCRVPDGVSAWQQSARWFHENDANCNTCANLQRVPHQKCKFGMLQGVCMTTGNALTFHPDDWMGMSCYISRWSDAA